MRPAVCLLICLVGCEPMQDPGGFGAIVNPVEVEAPAVAGLGTAPDTDYEDPVMIRSEDIQDQTPAPAPAPAPEPAADPTDHHTDSDPGAASTDGEPTADGQDPLAAGGAEAEEASNDGVTSSSWPLRLVKTLPDTNPPRAILGLPSGEEIVISPGKMIPEQGLVVMSIGPDSAELARVESDGDHAAISTVSLRTQY